MANPGHTQLAIEVAIYDEGLVSELRAHQKRRAVVTVVLRDGNPFSGRVSEVATTGAFVIIGGVHIPTETIEDLHA